MGRVAKMARTAAESGLGTLREVIALIWSEADRFVKVRLAAALLLTIVASAMSALGPVALKLVVERAARPLRSIRTPP